jgi:hypothetical protein
MPATRFVLGPFATVEILPAGVAPAPAEVQYDRVVFRDPKTSQGGLVHLSLIPGQAPDPVAVYAVFVTPPDAVPGNATPEWFFATGDPHGSVNTQGMAAPADFDIQVNVGPGLYRVQVIVEVPA